MKVLNLKINMIVLLAIALGLFMGCAVNVKSKPKNTVNGNANVVKEALVWQNIPGISFSDFHKAVKHKSYKALDVVYTNTLWVIPLPDGKTGTITIPLDKKYNNFFTRVCVVVDNPWPYETITVYCDGQEKEIIKKIGPKNAPRDLNINTKDVDVLTIKVKPGRKGYYEKVIFFDTMLKVDN